MISKTYILVLLSLAIFSGSCNLKNTKEKEKNEANADELYQLVWSDEFDYEGLPDSIRWAYDTEGNEAGWGNGESQIYTTKDIDNSFVSNGKLHIRAFSEKIEGKDFSSARLISKEGWKYGKIEVNARLPEGVGTWPAIWMMPVNWSFNDGNWPFIGEIDIMEHVGYDLGTIHASAHSQDYQWQAETQKTATIFIPDVNKEFHSYIVEWTPDVMMAYVDDSLYFKYENEGLGETKWPYDKPFYLILNVAVGGAWGAVKGIDTTAFPQTMEIDYVRVFELK